MNVVSFDMLRISAEDVKISCQTKTPTWLQPPCRDNAFVKLFTCFIYISIALPTQSILHDPSSTAQSFRVG